MSYMQETTIRLIRRPPAERSYSDIQFVLQWLRKKSQLLQGLDQGVLSELIRGCGYQKCRRNDLVIAQGDVGECMYIILEGQCDVYIDAAKTGEDELVSTTASDLLSSVYKASSSGASKVASRSPRKPKQVEIIEKISETPGKSPKLSARKTEVRFEEEAPDSAEALLDAAEQAIAPEEPSETIDEMLNHGDTKKAEKKRNKSKYGRYIMTFTEGRCFGELALMSEDSTRNATVLAEAESDLLVISRELYNHTLKAFQEKEFQQRRDFVSKHALFSGWINRFQRLLEMSLIKEIYPTGAPIIAQGAPANGLVFILSGQAKVFTEPAKHPQQYQSMTPFIVDDVTEGLNWIRGSKSPIKTSRSEEMTVRKKSVDIRRKAGYAALERLQASKVIPLSVVGPGEIIGEVEAVVPLKSYMQSVTAIDKVEVFILNAKNYDRLVQQKNLRTIDILKTIAETKLENRLQHLTVSQVPFFKHLLYLNKRVERPQSKEKEIELVPSKSLPDRDTLFKHMTECYINNQAELIEPIVPGSLFIRDVMRERARIRENIKSSRKQPLYGNRHKPARLQQLVYPRSNQRLKQDLQRQQNDQVNNERTTMVRNIRKLEMNDVRDELADSKTTKNTNLPTTGILRKLLPDDRRRVYHILEHELGVSLPSEPSNSTASSPDIETMKKSKFVRARVAKKRKVKKEKNSTKTKKKVEADAKIGHESGEEKTTEISADGLNMPFERTFITRMRAGSEPDLSRDPTRVSFDMNGGNQASSGDSLSKEGSADSKARDGLENQRSRPQSARADVTDIPGDYILPRPPIIPPIAITEGDEPDRKERKPKPKANTQETKRRNTQAKIRFMNDMIRQKLKMAPENPTYRDWETGESSVAYLETRINQFNNKQSEYMENPTPVALPQLKRFHADDEEPNQPRPGGRVYVQRQECPMVKTDFQLLDHKHTRFHMVPELPDYENLRRSRMLMQVVLDDVRPSGTRANDK